MFKECSPGINQPNWSVVIILIVLAFGFFHVHNTSAAGTPLGDLAVSMQPGTWATLTTNNINQTLSNTGGAAGSIFGYTEYIKWDRVGRRLYYMGSDHSGSSTQQNFARHVQYNEASNAWSILPQQSWAVFSPGNGAHGYDHGAIDPVHRYFYWRRYNDLAVFRYNMDTGVWTAMSRNNVIQFNSCCVGIDYFPELHGVLWAGDENGDSGGVTRLNDATGQWDRIGKAAAYPMGDLHNFAEYNPIYKVMVFGGGESGTAARKIYKLDATGGVTSLRDPPVDVGINNSVFTVDPVSGDYLVFTNTRQFYVYNVSTDTWTLRASGSAIPIWTTSYGNPIFGAVGGPIDTYGVNVFVTCDGPNNCRVTLYKHSPAGSGSSPAPPDTNPPTSTVTVVNAPASPTSSLSFAQKCAQSGVINCFSFDSASSLFYTWPTGTSCDAALSGQTNNGFGRNRRGPGNTAAVVQNGQCVYPQVDATTSHSGAGSLKFTIPSNSDANSSGFFTEPFKRNSDGTFPYIGPGSSLGNVLYFQFYQKFDTNFVNTDYQCTDGECTGWKQAIWFGNPPNGSSSSNLEVTMNNGWQRSVSQMYGQSGSDDFGIEDSIGCTFAKATSQGGSGSGFNSRPNYQAPLNPACFHFIPDQWMEFTGRIEIRGAANAPASRVQLWINGQPAIDYGAARIDWSGPDGNGLGQFQLTPYHTRKDPGRAHPAGFTWYDDLIVSTQPIAMGGSSNDHVTVNNSPPPDTTRPTVSMTSPANGSTVSGTITVSAAASDNVGVAGVPATGVANAGTVAFIQGAAATDDDNSKTIARAFAAATTPGDLIVVAISWGTKGSVSCSDSQRDTYAVATNQYDGANNQSLAICYAANIKGGADTITATFSGAAPPYRRLLIHEYRGIALSAPLDIVASKIADGSTRMNAITSGAATTTASGDLVFGAVMDDTGVNNIAAGAGFTQRQSVNNKDLISEDLVQTSSGAIAATSTFSDSHRYLAQMVTFKHR